MSHNHYSEINLHLTWHTKDSLPLLTQRVEPLVHRYLRQKIVDEPGAFVHVIGGTETHVHIAVTVPPTLLISDFVGRLKGASAHDVNEQLGSHGRVLQWQAGYGVVSFGTGDLEWVKGYIRDQRQHHASGEVKGYIRDQRQHHASGEAEPGVNAGPITACGGNARERAWRGPQPDTGFCRHSSCLRENVAYVFAQQGLMNLMSQNAISSSERDERRKTPFGAQPICHPCHRMCFDWRQPCGPASSYAAEGYNLDITNCDIKRRRETPCRMPCLTTIAGG